MPPRQKKAAGKGAKGASGKGKAKGKAKGRRKKSSGKDVEILSSGRVEIDLVGGRGGRGHAGSDRGGGGAGAGTSHERSAAGGGAGAGAGAGTPSAARRLARERKQWRRDHPTGFSARPAPNPDGSTNLFEWDVLIPGPPDTVWSGAAYAATLAFPAEYPRLPPTLRFDPVLFHPNVYLSGLICMSLLNPEPPTDWHASTSVRTILLGAQQVLADPCTDSPAQADAYMLYRHDRAAYNVRVREQAHAAQRARGDGADGGGGGGGGGGHGGGRGGSGLRGAGVATCPHEVD